MSADQTATVLLADLVGLVLLVAAVSTWQRRADYPGIVRSYQILPSRLATVVGHGLHPVELAVGAGLLTGVRLVVLVAAVAATVLFAGFAAGLSINLIRGRTSLDCGCFGFGAHPPAAAISWWLAGRAGVLAVLSGVVAVALPGTLSASQRAALLSVAAGVALLAVLVAELRTVVTLRASAVDSYLARARRHMNGPIS